MPTNLYNSVTIGDTEYLIQRFDAKTGLKLARLLISKAAPIIPLLDKLAGDEKPGKGKKAEKGRSVDMSDESLYKAVGLALENLEDKDLDNLIDKCLRVCYVNLPGGMQPIIDETGNYGIEGVEYDLPLTLRLCFEAIKWGASDFFAGIPSLSNLFHK